MIFQSTGTKKITYKGGKENMNAEEILKDIMPAPSGNYWNGTSSIKKSTIIELVDNALKIQEQEFNDKLKEISSLLERYKQDQLDQYSKAMTEKDKLHHSSTNLGLSVAKSLIDTHIKKD